MVVQEAGNLGGIPTGNIDAACNKVHVLNIFNDTGYFTYWVPWVRTSPGGNVRCSLAIFALSSGLICSAQIFRRSSVYMPCVR